MITISLDEQGKFEETNSTDAEFIAGVIYDDGGDAFDTQNERQRIFKFYCNAISEAKDTSSSRMSSEFVFPGALHANDNNKIREHEVVRPVKQVVSKRLPEFIEKGTYNGRLLMSTPRRGKYHLYAILKSDRGISDLTSADTNKLTKDTYGANLYYHMATRVVGRLVCHNPIMEDEKKISLNLATRCSGNMLPNNDKAKELISTGHIDKSSNNNEVYFYLTGPEMYRTALSLEMIKSGKTDISIDDFHIISIGYKTRNKREFLYLADTICSILGFELKGKNAADWIVEFKKRMNRINSSNKNMIWGYDDIDVVYEKAYEAYENNDYYEALSYSYAGINFDSSFSAYYKDIWFRDILGKIEKSGNVNAFVQAVDQLYNSLFTNKYKQEKAIYIFEILLKQSDVIIGQLSKQSRESVMGKLYDAAISIYCHVGDSENARKYFEKYLHYIPNVGVDSYLDVLNKMVVVQLDSFEWDTAKRDAKESVALQEMYLEMKNEVSAYKEFEKSNSLGLCKAKSQLGQVLANMRNPEAEECFREALQGLEPNSANYKITQSYLMHFYIDMKMEVKYRQESILYFGGADTPEKQLGVIFGDAFTEYPKYSYQYALYVLIKGIYTFDLDKVDYDLYTKLININKSLQEIRQKKEPSGAKEPLSGHPSELIYRYLAFIALSRADMEHANSFIERSMDSIGEKGKTIELIQAYGQYLFYKRSKNDIKKIECEKKLKKITSEFETLKGLSSISNEMIEDYMSKWLTFMYI